MIDYKTLTHDDLDKPNIYLRYLDIQTLLNPMILLPDIDHKIKQHVLHN